MAGSLFNLALRFGRLGTPGSHSGLCLFTRQGTLMIVIDLLPFFFRSTTPDPPSPKQYWAMAMPNLFRRDPPVGRPDGVRF